MLILVDRMNQQMALSPFLCTFIVHRNKRGPDGFTTHRQFIFGREPNRQMMHYRKPKKKKDKNVMFAPTGPLSNAGGKCILIIIQRPRKEICDSVH